MALRIIATGGTFDKQYDPIRGLLTFEDSHLPEILKTARIHEDTKLEIVTLIDSLDMEENQRRAVLDACIRAPENRIIIVHGTDTMTETARLIGAASLSKCIILTGAMVPYSVAKSDALFNLGSAVMASSLLENGTWIAMNGRVLGWKNARKDRTEGVFVTEETAC